MRGLGDRAAALVGGTLSSWLRIADGNLSAVCRMTLHDGRTMVAKSAVTAGQEATMLRAVRNSGAPHRLHHQQVLCRPEHGRAGSTATFGTAISWYLVAQCRR